MDETRYAAACRSRLGQQQGQHKPPWPCRICQRQASAGGVGHDENEREQPSVLTNGREPAQGTMAISGRERTISLRETGSARPGTRAAAGAPDGNIRTGQHGTGKRTAAAGSGTRAARYATKWRQRNEEVAPSDCLNVHQTYTQIRQKARATDSALPQYGIVTFFAYRSLNPLPDASWRCPAPARRLLPVARCPLPVACCLLPVACAMRLAACIHQPGLARGPGRVEQVHDTPWGAAMNRLMTCSS